MAIQYKRILLKVSGEALSGPKGTGFDEETIASICAGIKAAHDLGAQIGIVVGGGNFWRGRSSGKMDRMDADKIGMLATVMNALAVKDALRQQGVDAVVMTSSFMPQVAECFTSDKAIAALESGKIVVFGGGTGNPIFSTDTASALRALEIGADAMFKATMVDGVYDKDPHKYADAVRYDTLTFTRVLSAWPSWTPPPRPSAATTVCPSSCSIWASPPTLPRLSRAKASVPWSGNKTQKHKLKNSYFPPILS